jgi:hypothetical protein
MVNCIKLSNVTLCIDSLHLYTLLHVLIRVDVRVGIISTSIITVENKNGREKMEVFFIESVFCRIYEWSWVPSTAQKISGCFLFLVNMISCIITRVATYDTYLARYIHII